MSRRPFYYQGRSDIGYMSYGEDRTAGYPNPFPAKRFGLNADGTYNLAEIVRFANWWATEARSEMVFVGKFPNVEFVWHKKRHLSKLPEGYRKAWAQAKRQRELWEQDRRVG